MIIYANTLHNGFVHDDVFTITDNTFIKDFKNLHGLIESDYFVLSSEESYRPFVTFTYFLDYYLFGLQPLGYHLSNILIHSVNGVLLYIFILLLTEKSAFHVGNAYNISTYYPFAGFNFQPTIITLIFITNPVSTETINAISYREDLLAFFFYMLTLILYIRLKSFQIFHSSILVYLISYLLYFFALLSKEMALTLPIVIYIYEWIYIDKKDKCLPSILNKFNMGYIAVTLIYVYLRFYYFKNPVYAAPSPSIQIERLITIPWLILNYLRLTLFPISLSADYEIAFVRSISSPMFIVPLIIAFSILLMLFKMKNIKKETIFGFLFFIVTLIPVYNIIPLNNPIAERYLYLPTVGVAIITGSIIYWIFGALNFKAQKLSYDWVKISFFIIIVIYSLMVVKRNEAWSNDYALWSDTVKKNHHSSRAHINLGKEYHDKGRLDNAIKEYAEAIRLKPGFMEAHYNLGLAYLEQGRLTEAIKEHMIALKLDPNDADVHNSLGNAYYEEGRFVEAMSEYTASLRLRANYPEAHNNLGSAYASQGMLSEAIKEYTIAIRQKPDYLIARYSLGLAYLKIGLRDKAKIEFEQILKLNPNDLQARKALESLK